MIPIEEFIAGTESLLGIQNDGFILSDNFEEFDYDSSNVIANLEVMYLFLLILLALPCITLLLFLLFFWSSKCMKWQTKFRRDVYFNLYIRFAFEAYLEVSLTALIRLQNLKFGSYSDNFNSIFAIVLLVSALSFMLVTCVKL